MDNFIFPIKHATVSHVAIPYAFLRYCAKIKRSEILPSLLKIYDKEISDDIASYFYKFIKRCGRYVKPQPENIVNELGALLLGPITKGIKPLHALQGIHVGFGFFHNKKFSPRDMSLYLVTSVLHFLKNAPDCSEQTTEPIYTILNDLLATP